MLPYSIISEQDGVRCFYRVHEGHELVVLVTFTSRARATAWCVVTTYLTDVFFYFISRHVSVLDVCGWMVAETLLGGSLSWRCKSNERGWLFCFVGILSFSKCLFSMSCILFGLAMPRSDKGEKVLRVGEEEVVRVFHFEQAMKAKHGGGKLSRGNQTKSRNIRQTRLWFAICSTEVRDTFPTASVSVFFPYVVAAVHTSSGVSSVRHPRSPGRKVTPFFLLPHGSSCSTC
ncbi:unnamed protein product, partial [Ectocarpus sp. 13 AM-2016]